jgi:hypothetical protein
VRAGELLSGSGRAYNRSAMLEVTRRDWFDLAGALDADLPRDGSTAAAPGGVGSSGKSRQLYRPWREEDDVMAFKVDIFTRGVLFDMARHKGARYLGDEEAFYPRRFGDLQAPR